MQFVYLFTSQRVIAVSQCQHGKRMRFQPTVRRAGVLWIDNWTRTRQQRTTAATFNSFSICNAPDHRKNAQPYLGVVALLKFISTNGSCHCAATCVRAHDENRARKLAQIATLRQHRETHTQLVTQIFVSSSKGRRTHSHYAFRLSKIENLVHRNIFQVPMFIVVAMSIMKSGLIYYVRFQFKCYKVALIIIYQLHSQNLRTVVKCVQNSPNNI